MRPLRLFVALTLVLGVAGVAVPFGQGRGAAPPAGAAGQTAPPVIIGNGFIAGQVVDVPSGKPVPEAIVTLAGRLVVPGGGRGVAGLNNQVIADAQGRFIFGSLAIGTFVITATKPGYLSSRSVTLVLADGEKVMDSRVRLTRTASLSGTLRDVVGDPVVGTFVYVVNRAVVNGQQTWQIMGAGRSDDRGVYRVGGLLPGDYVTCACTRDPIPIDGTLMNLLSADPAQMMTVGTRALTGGGDAASLDPGTRTYPPTFHQNSTTLARATKITVGPGEEKTGVDMNLEVVRGTRVSGTIVGAPGPVQANGVRLVPAGDAGLTTDMFSVTPLLVQADGRFDFAQVPPGQYRLVVVYRDAAGRGGARGGGGAAAAPAAPVATMSGGPISDLPPWWGSELITVGERGLQGVVVTLKPGAAVRGRIQFIGSTPPPTDILTSRPPITIGVLNRSDPLAQIGGNGLGRFAPDATFTVPGAIPGMYTIYPLAFGGFPNLKSVLVGGLDLTDLPLEIGDKDVSDVVITYADTLAAELTVTTNAATTSPPFDDAWALAFPVDRKYWIEPAAASRRFRASGISNKGSVSLVNLPAGEYFIAVTTGLDSDWIEATRLDLLSRKAQRIWLNDGDKKTIEVRR